MTGTPKFLMYELHQSADIGAELAAGTLEKLPTSASDMGFGGPAAMTALTGGGDTATEPSGPSRAEASRLRRERDAANAYRHKLRKRAHEMA